ncbi:MAG: 16S rRNA (cytosine(1402)-N(4))-methyltransferase RsmH [Bernardetiaceae bacterium]|nr:16S rRNA (cytosine(1402)-N(4))-methyltransferase RsmH [Bernardetiaceae bacterium]
MEYGSEYHQPVMLSACMEGLQIIPRGVYVDVTFGGGGHSRAILEYLEEGRLYSFDQDEDAAKEATQIKHLNFTFVKANFRYLKKYLRLYGTHQVDGILADLGVSSYQIDTPERGFSTRFEGDLDMRMNRENPLTAAEILNTYSETDLQYIFGAYGEVRNAKTLARAIITQRSNEVFTQNSQLKEVLLRLAPKRKEFRYMAQVFQALRIEVNDELAALREFLVESVEVLKPGGRLVIMSYHSLEDRLVKNFIQKGKFKGEVEKDIYGNVLAPLKAIHRKAVVATPEEVAQNPRARSAKLRVAMKL